MMKCFSPFFVLFLGKPNGRIVQHEFPTYPQGMIYACQDNAWMDECWKPPSPFSNVHFRNTTKILQHKFFTLKLLFIFTLSLLKVSFPQTRSFSCIFVFASSFICMDLSIMSTSTSLTFPEFLVLFSSISLLFSFIESHFALSSARCHL